MIKEYTREEIVSRLGSESGVILAQVGPNEDYLIPTSIFNDKPGERILGLFEGILTEGQVEDLDVVLPEDWVFLYFGPSRGRWSPETILRLIDEHKVGVVRDVSASGMGRMADAHEALKALEARQKIERRQRMDHLRSAMGENVRPCRKCGDNLLPDGLLRHECS